MWPKRLTHPVYLQLGPLTPEIELDIGLTRGQEVLRGITLEIKAGPGLIRVTKAGLRRETERRTKSAKLLLSCLMVGRTQTSQ